MSSQVVTGAIILNVCPSQHTAAVYLCSLPPRRKHPKQIRLILPWLYLIRTLPLPSRRIRWKLDFLQRFSNQTCVKVEEKRLQRETRSKGQVQLRSDVSRMFVPSCSWWVPDGFLGISGNVPSHAATKSGCRARLRLQLSKNILKPRPFYIISQFVQHIGVKVSRITLKQ